jgi:hypothetical protein
VNPRHAGEVHAARREEHQHHVDAQPALLAPVDVGEVQEQRVLIKNERLGDAVADTE